MIDGMLTAASGVTASVDTVLIDAGVASWPWPVTVGLGVVALGGVVAIVVRNWPRGDRSAGAKRFREEPGDPGVAEKDEGVE